MQNDKAKFSDMIKMFNSTSTVELSKMIVQSEQEAEQSMQQQIQQQQQAEMQMQQSQQEFELTKLQMELDNKIQIAEINSFARQMDQDSDDNGIPDQFEIQKFEIESKLKAKKLELDELKTKADIRQRDEELKIKNKVANKPRAK